LLPTSLRVWKLLEALQEQQQQQRAGERNTAGWVWHWHQDCCCLCVSGKALVVSPADEEASQTACENANGHPCRLLAVHLTATAQIMI
jgi:hypothetical protein